MSQVLVVNTNESLSLTGCAYSAIGYDSLLPSSAITGAAEDPDYPFSNALDYRDNTKYSPLAASGTVVIEFRQDSATAINYLGFAIHNGQTAGLTGKLEYTANGVDWITVFEFSGLTDDKTFMHVFDSIYGTRQRLTLNFTSKLFISCIYMGEAKLMSHTPTLGFQPGRYAPLDEVEQFSTEGNNFIVGRRVKRGYQSKGTFDYLEFLGDVDQWYEDFQNHVLDSKPVFFKWSSDLPESMFGLQNPSTMTKPTYKTSFHTDISFEINGYR